MSNYELKNKNFELVGEITPDIEAALIASDSDIGLEDCFNKLLALKPKCSIEIQKGIEQHINFKKKSLNKIMELLKEGHYLASTINDSNERVITFVDFNSLDEFLMDSRCQHASIRRIEDKGNIRGLNYGIISKNSKREISHVHVDSDQFGEEFKKQSNPLFKQEITLAHKFNRFDIVKVPFYNHYIVIVDKDEAEDNIVVEYDKGAYKCDFYGCRLRTGMDDPYNELIYEHHVSIVTLNNSYYKVEYNDAPFEIQELVNYLKSSGDN